MTQLFSIKFTKRLLTIDVGLDVSENPILIFVICFNGKTLSHLYLTFLKSRVSVWQQTNVTTHVLSCYRLNAVLIAKAWRDGRFENVDVIFKTPKKPHPKDLSYSGLQKFQGKTGGRSKFACTNQFPKVFKISARHLINYVIWIAYTKKKSRSKKLKSLK